MRVLWTTTSCLHMFTTSLYIPYVKVTDLAWKSFWILKTEWTKVFKHKDPRAWSLTDLEKVGGFMWACRRSHCVINYWNCYTLLNGWNVEEIALFTCTLLYCFLKIDLDVHTMVRKWYKCCTNTVLTRELIHFKATHSLNYCTKAIELLKVVGPSLQCCYSILYQVRFLLWIIPTLEVIKDIFYAEAYLLGPW